jgi:hypothetical protein
MFDLAHLDAGMVVRGVRALGALPRRGADDGELVDQIAALEMLKNAAAAAQARLAVELDRSQRQAQRDAGVPAPALGAGVAAQVALARRESAHRGARHLGLAHALVEEMPHTLAALEAGTLSEWRATLLAQETACLTREDRGVVEAELAGRPGGLGSLGDREVAAEARRIAYRLDPHAVTRRAGMAAAARRVTVRPAPDTMAVVSGLLPAPQGVAVFAALSRQADTLRASGDQRTRGQIMADTLVERVTGQTAADQVPVEVQIVMTDTTLLGTDHTAAHLPGYGPVPAPLARTWVRDSEGDVWVRRLYSSPHTGQLVAMESTRRCFTGLLRRYVVLRDQVCRTPWCSAPVRHVDHVRSVAAGGATAAANAQGLCEACNLAKEAPGWRAETGPAGEVHTTTPTARRYTSHPPGPPGTSPRLPTTRAELFFRDLVLAR